MIRINIHEAKTHLSHYLKRLRPGEVLLICKRNVPVAEVRGVSSRGTTRRPLGLARDELKIPASFFEALPDEDVSSFDGQDGP